MDINQLLSTQATNLLSPPKLPCLQSKSVDGVERPLIIPLGGTANLGNPLGMVPVPFLNQQLLVPLTAFQAAKESLPLHPGSSMLSSSSDSKASKSQPLVYTQQQVAAFGANTSPAKDNSFSFIIDPNQASIIQPVQSKSPINLNPVQYAELITKTQEKTSDTAVSGKSLSEVKKSCSSSTSAMSKDSSQDKTCHETEMPNSSGNDIDNKLDSESISRIISSLPPGWRVVGLTNLVGTDRTQPTPVVETLATHFGSNTTCDDSTSHLASPHYRCGIPDVVSVDLNVPTSLSLTPDSFDSKTMENITLPLKLAENPISNLLPSSSQSQKLSHSSSKLTQDTAIGLDQFPINIKKEADAITSPTISNELSQSEPKLDLDLLKHEWKVVGLTSLSLPQTSISNSHPQVSSASLPFPMLISQEPGGTVEDRQTNSRSPKATILNVPSPKLIQQSVKTSSQQKLSSFDMKSCSDEIKWTIVGITTASTISTAAIMDPASGLDSISGIKVNSGNSDDIKADCLVTSSQQRPLPSSVSKNAPLTSEITDKGVDSILLKDQWKVVGVTQLTDEKSIPQIPSVGYQVPVPLLQQPQPPILVTSVNSLIPTSTTHESDKLIPTSPPCLSSAGLHQNSLIGTLNNTMSLLTPPSLSVPPSNSLLEQQQLLHLVQNQLHQQQEQLMLGHIQSQLAQNQTPLMNTLNDWNLVGLLSKNSTALTSAGNQPDIFNPFPVVTNEKMSDQPVKVEHISEQAVTINKEQLLLNTCKVEKEDDSYSQSKRTKQIRNKDMAAKFTKKNTVSHLLKLKRMKMKEKGEDGPLSQSDTEDYEVVTSMKHDNGKIAFLTRGDRGIRSRPLHSYAGNRKIFTFTKTFALKKEAGKEKINLRSGVQVPVQDMELDVQKNQTDLNNELSANNNGNVQLCNESFLVNNNRSAARKRKLKVPRKMIADLDYQPFDSSSDSN